MFSRRTFMRGGLSAVAMGLYGKRALAQRAGAPSSASLIVGGKSGVFKLVPPAPRSIMVDGMPFADWFTGDDFPNDGIPFHVCENCFNHDEPPPPTGEADIVIAGGGISGLSTAFLLRQRRPVVFELHDNFGGNAQGEIWAETPYSLGNAYIITPDKGSFLESFYRQIGLNLAVREQSGEDIIELNNQLLTNFIHGQGFSLDELEALQRYTDLVKQMGEDYPDIPLPKDKDNQWILDLDAISLKEHIEQQVKLPIPPLLAAAIQGYCFSSFAEGWDKVSAASGWNFLAAEEFGRWVFPGGSAYIADAMWRRLHMLDLYTFKGANSPHLRPGHRVIDVRLTQGDRVQVTYANQQNEIASMLAKRVVMCMPKHIAKRVIHDIDRLDPGKFESMQQVETHAYVVVNVLLDAPIDQKFYDIFLLGDGDYPRVGDDLPTLQVTDMLNGEYARRQDVPRSVLTLYTPFPNLDGRFVLLEPDIWMTAAQTFVPQIRRMLDILHVPLSAVVQARMTRWGHAMPIARPGFIAEGHPQRLRRPIKDKIFFINQDNWALPAVENCLLDAAEFADQISAGL